MPSRRRLLVMAMVGALLLAGRSQASLTRPSVTDRESSAEGPVALEGPPAPAQRFDLFAGDELARATHENAEGFHPLAAVSLLSEDARLDLASEPDARYPKTRVWAIDVLGSTLVSRSSGLSLESGWACGDFSCGLASGGRKDPLGLQESAWPAGASPIRVPAPLMPEPIPMVRGQRPNPWARYDVSPQYLAPGAPPESLDAFRAALLEAEERNHARPVGVGSRALGGRTADELTPAEQAEFLEHRRLMRTDPAYRRQAEGIGRAIAELRGARLPWAAAGGAGGGDEPPGIWDPKAGRYRDPKTGQFVSDPSNPPSPYEFTDAQRRLAWKSIVEDPNSQLTPEQRAQVEARGWRGPQRWNRETGEWETMELSHEPVPLREGGTEVVPRWPGEHAAVDPYRRLPNGS